MGGDLNRIGNGWCTARDLSRNIGEVGDGIDRW
jgi:hypothetical protein